MKRVAPLLLLCVLYSYVGFEEPLGDVRTSQNAAKAPDLEGNGIPVPDGPIEPTYSAEWVSSVDEKNVARFSAKRTEYEFIELWVDTQGAGISYEDNGALGRFDHPFIISNDTLGSGDNGVVIKTNDREHLVVTGEGNVGLGAISPQTRLHVKGNVRIEDWGNTEFGYGDDTSNSNYITYGNTGKHVYRTYDGSSYTDVGAWDAAGKLGIGTSSPQAGLHVKRNLRIEDWGNTEFGYGDDTSNSNYITYGNTGKHVYRTYDGSSYTDVGAWDAAGKLGIGTSSPQAGLHVKRNLRIENWGNTEFGYGDNATSSNYMTYGDAGKHIYRIYDGSSYANIGAWDSEGNLGIGTINPNNKLDVNGTVRAKEIIVESGWSDFVFERGYKLMPIEKVSEYIDKNGRLPGIPSADEVQARGLSVGESQEKLLQKIEELTLYLIKQQKEIKDLEFQMKQLRAQQGQREG